MWGGGPFWNSINWHAKRVYLHDTTQNISEQRLARLGLNSGLDSKIIIHYSLINRNILCLVFLYKNNVFLSYYSNFESPTSLGEEIKTLTSMCLFFNHPDRHRTLHNYTFLNPYRGQAIQGDIRYGTKIGPNSWMTILLPTDHNINHKGSLINVVTQRKIQKKNPIKMYDREALVTYM